MKWFETQVSAGGWLVSNLSDNKCFERLQELTTTQPMQTVEKDMKCAPQGFNKNNEIGQINVLF